MEKTHINGIINIGNTCYMNSVLQLLINCTVLTKFILNTNFNNTKINCYKKFLLDYFSDNLVRPDIIKLLFPQFNNCYQHDAHEFLLNLIDVLNDEIKRDFNEQKIINISVNKLIDILFDIKINSIIYCNETSDESKSKNNEKILSLSIPKNIENINLTDCINNFQEIEFLTGESKWFNEKDNNYYDAIKKFYIKSYPKYLKHFPFFFSV